jgi:hypothetical protein
MSDVHEQVGPFLDGELPPAEADAFRLHLGSCVDCQQELLDFMQLRGLARALKQEQQASPNSITAPAAIATPTSPPINKGDDKRGRVLPFPSRRFLVRAAVAVGSLAAAVVAVVLAQSIGHGKTSFDLGPNRLVEVRLSYQPADGYRPYNVTRAADTHWETALSLSSLSWLESHGDEHGVAVGHLLRGELDAAQSSLAQADAKNPDVISDHAALALLQGQPATSFTLSQQALKLKPRHPQATWNEGLALEQMGLLGEASRSFNSVATYKEQGWSEEAQERARSLYEQVQSFRTEVAAGKKLALQLALEGKPLPNDWVEQHAELARAAFYQAVAAAPTAERLQALSTLAATLDSRYEGHVLANELEAITKKDFAARAPLASAFQVLLSGQMNDPARRATFMSQLESSDQPDIVLQALPLLDALPQELKAYQAAADQLGDPWFLTRAGALQVHAALDAGASAQAEEMLTKLKEHCQSEPLLLPCIELEIEMSREAEQTHHLDEAMEHAQQALRWARSSRQPNQVVAALNRLAQLHQADGTLVEVFHREGLKWRPDETIH